MGGFRKFLVGSVAAGFVASVAVAAITVAPAGGAFPGANGKIAFYKPSPVQGDIFVMNPDGSGLTNVTNTPGSGDVYPAWSADGTKIAFMSNRDGNSEIYVMNADGTAQTNLTNNAVEDDDPAWSPDGTKIVFTRLGSIWVMNADGTGDTQLASSVDDFDPAWSPDGTKIAFARRNPSVPDIYVMNAADGTGQTNLTNSGALIDRHPNWSPDGTQITFDTGPAGTSNIYVMNANGTGQTAVTSNGVNGAPAWSPDGTKIVFGTFSGEIKVMNANGTGQTTLTSAGGGSPDWQPLVYSFNGFFPPVDNLPTLNLVKAGRGVPVKFSLGGDRGLNILAAGYPRSEQITCGLSTPVDGIEETVNAGGSSLSYDATTDQYIYVWKTAKTWAGTCRQLVVKFADLTVQRANFKFA